jgi:hypothetical protein
MTRQTLRTAYYCVGGLAVCAAVLFMLWGTYTQDREERGVQGWPHTEGVLESAKIVRGLSRGATYKVQVRYRYRVDGREYSRSRFSPAGDRYGLLPVALERLQGALGKLTETRPWDITDRQILDRELLAGPRPVAVFYNPKYPRRAFLDNSEPSALERNPHGQHATYLILAVIAVAFFGLGVRSGLDLLRSRSGQDKRISEPVERRGRPHPIVRPEGRLRPQESEEPEEPGDASRSAYEGWLRGRERPSPARAPSGDREFDRIMDLISPDPSCHAGDILSLEVYDHDVNCWAVGVHWRDGRTTQLAASSEAEAYRIKALLERQIPRVG